MYSCDDEVVIISCAGYYGDDEAVLKWIKEGEEVNIFIISKHIELSHNEKCSHILELY